MRASRVTEHKLVLQEFVRTPAGQHMLRAAAAASGTTVSGLAGQIAELPAMDFYAPFREHRASWRGSTDVVVAATLDENAVNVLAYGTDGARVALDARDGVPGRPLLLLHPAERKSPRFNPQPDTPGDVIQDFGDGESSGTININCTGCEVDHNPGESSGGGGGGSTAPADTAWVEDLWVSNRDGFGANEIELRTRFFRNGIEIASRTARFEGIQPEIWYHPHALLMHQRPQEGSGDYFRVRVVETDAFDSDDYGTRNFYATDNNQRRSIVDDGSWFEIQMTTTIKLSWTPRYY